MYSTIYFLICMLSSAHFPSHQLSTEIQFMGEGSSALLLPSILSDNGATDLEVSSVFIPLFWHFHFDIDNCSYFIWLWVKYNKKDSCLITNGSTVCKKKISTLWSFKKPSFQPSHWLWNWKMPPNKQYFSFLLSAGCDPGETFKRLSLHAC